MGGLVVDTCIFIAAEKRDIPLNFDHLIVSGKACMSAITVSELLVGVHHANSEARRLKRSLHIKKLLETIDVLDFDTKVARIHAEINATLSKQHISIGPHDLLIAATALTYGYPLLTSNVKEFSRVPGLNVLNYFLEE